MNHIKKLLSVTIVVLSTFTSINSYAEKKPVDKVGVATGFVQAINQNDINKAIHLTGSHLTIRNQGWESALDGTGFVLGKAQDVSLNDQGKIKSWYTDNISRIGIEGKQPSKVKLDLLKNELKGIEPTWKDVDIYLFLRGMGDVEHVFVVGVNAIGKVATLYFN